MMSPCESFCRVLSTILSFCDMAFSTAVDSAVSLSYLPPSPDMKEELSSNCRAVIMTFVIRIHVMPKKQTILCLGKYYEVLIACLKLFIEEQLAAFDEQHH